MIQKMRKKAEKRQTRDKNWQESCPFQLSVYGDMRADAFGMGTIENIPPLYTASQQWQS